MKKKKKEKEPQIWSLKEFRNQFGNDVSIKVVKCAYRYAQNGNQPQSSIATSAVLYADPFKKRDMNCLGVMAEQESGKVTIWNLQTETPSAQRALLQGEWDYHNRSLCISRLGENFICTRRTTLRFPSERIIGVYAHYHRFVAVVSIKSDIESTIATTKLQEMAATVAKNALAHYPEYLHRMEMREYNLKHHYAISEELPEYKDFLLKQIGRAHV